MIEDGTLENRITLHSVWFSSVCLNVSAIYVAFTYYLMFCIAQRGYGWGGIH